MAGSVCLITYGAPRSAAQEAPTYCPAPDDVHNLAAISQPKLTALGFRMAPQHGRPGQGEHRPHLAARGFAQSYRARLTMNVPVMPFCAWPGTGNR